MKKLTDKERQFLSSLLPILEERKQRKIDTIREFKWLCNVPQVGEEYMKNKNVWDLQDTAIKTHEDEYDFQRNTIIKLLDSY